VSLKRAYEPAAAEDGVRVLVDRLWPRGLSRKELHVDFWLKDVAPSHDLRRWFAHKPGRWKSFTTKYRAELAMHADLLDLVEDLARRSGVTLLYSARDAAHNNAVVLRDFLDERRRRGRKRAPGKP
jgi:uncharacterized protein YeaO (DUF488 family)